MRRLARRLFTLCSAVSLVLCVLLTVSLIASYYETDEVDRIRTGVDGNRGWSEVWGVASAEGRLMVGRNDGRFDVDASSHGEFEKWLGDEAPGWRVKWTPADEWGMTFRRDRWWHRLGFDYTDTVNPQAQQAGVVHRSRVLVVPITLPLLASALLPAWWLRRHLRERRRAATGMCLWCGYDLRASPDRCPECGMTAAAQGNP